MLSQTLAESSWGMLSQPQQGGSNRMMVMYGVAMHYQSGDSTMGGQRVPSTPRCQRNPQEGALAGVSAS